MKLLLIGSNEVWSLERIYHKYLSLNPQLSVEHYSTSGLKKVLSATFNKIIFRLFPNNNYILRNFNKELISYVQKTNPDVILVFKGMEIMPSSLKLLKNRVKLVNYNPDHPFIIYSRGSGNKNVQSSVHLYDLHFSYNRNVCDILNRDYKVNCHWLPFGYELDEDSYKKFDTEEKLSIGFIGNPDPLRVSLIKRISKAGLPIEVYGHNWSKYLSKNNFLKINSPVYGEDFWKTLMSHRVCLNIFRPHNVNSHNMRTFEIPAAGSIMLAPSSIEHKEFFEEEREAFYYKDENDLLSKANNILNMPFDKAKSIGLSARQRCINDKYSYNHRVSQLYDFLLEHK